jgi:hypothetical protein
MSRSKPFIMLEPKFETCPEILAAAEGCLDDLEKCRMALTADEHAESQMALMLMRLFFYVLEEGEADGSVALCPRTLARCVKYRGRKDVLWDVLTREAIIVPASDAGRYTVPSFAARHQSLYTRQAAKRAAEQARRDKMAAEKAAIEARRKRRAELQAAYRRRKKQPENVDASDTRVDQQSSTPGPRGVHVVSTVTLQHAENRPTDATECSKARGVHVPHKEEDEDKDKDQKKREDTQIKLPTPREQVATTAELPEPEVMHPGTAMAEAQEQSVLGLPPTEHARFSRAMAALGNPNQPDDPLLDFAAVERMACTAHQTFNATRARAVKGLGALSYTEIRHAYLETVARKGKFNTQYFAGVLVGQREDAARLEQLAAVGGAPSGPGGRPGLQPHKSFKQMQNESSAANMEAAVALLDEVYE